MRIGGSAGPKNYSGEALIAEALEKGYKNITIQDVTKRADVGYRTYFRHYNGLDELLISIAQDRLDEIYEILNLPQLGNLSERPGRVFPGDRAQDLPAHRGEPGQYSLFAFR